MNTPRVSVIVPTYNRARLVCATLESVFAQSYQDFEIIVVDDGSTDDTAAAVAAYGDRVRYLRQANRGVNPARNCGIAAARGEFIALADSDDLWEPWKLATQVKLLETYPAVGFVFSDFFILKGDASAPNGIASWHGVSREWREIYDEYQQYSSLTLEVGPGGDFAVYRGDIYERSLYEPMVLPSTALMRRAALQATGLAFPEITETCGDWEFFARLSKARGALYMDVETAFNRSHEDAVRLTRFDPRIRLGRRVAMIDRLWRADPEFAARNAREIDAVQRRLLYKLARMNLYSSEQRAARAVLARASRLSHAAPSMNEYATQCLAWIPGSGHLLRLTRGWSRAS